MTLGFPSNASLSANRSDGTYTARGFDQTGTKTILDCRGDAQESGRTLERLQQVHETGDVLFFAEEDVTDVNPGDNVTLEMDDGRTLEGSVEKVIGIDDSLLIGLA